MVLCIDDTLSTSCWCWRVHVVCKSVFVDFEGCVLHWQLRTNIIEFVVCLFFFFFFLFSFFFFSFFFFFFFDWLIDLCFSIFQFPKYQRTVLSLSNVAATTTTMLIMSPQSNVFGTRAQFDQCRRERRAQLVCATISLRRPFARCDSTRFESSVADWNL